MARPVSPLLNSVGIVAGFGALVGAAWVGYSALVLLLGLALSAALVTKLWSRICLKRVMCERRLSERRVFPGDEVLLTLRVVNRKVLPLPWIMIRDELPTLLASSSAAQAGAGEDASAETTTRPGFVAVSRSTPLRWYSAASFTHKLNSSARGYYPLGPLSVVSGDIFGLHPRSHVQHDIDHLIVYPHTYALSEIGLPSLSHLGDARSDLKVFDDPSRLTGVREYVPGDNPRRIHWKASARSRTMQVKLFESTTDLKVAVFLAVDTFAEQPQDDFELGISAAASVARHLLEREVQTGLFANTKLADTGYAARVAAGSGTDHLALILEVLAKTTSDTAESFVDFFDRERSGLGFGGTLVFVVGDLSSPVGLLMADLAGSGRRVLGFHVGSRSEECDTPGVRWHQVRRPVASGHSELDGAPDPTFDEVAVA